MGPLEGAIRELAGKDMFNMLTAEVRFSTSGTVVWTPCVLRTPMLGITGPGTATWQRGDGRPTLREIRGRGEYFPVLDFRVR